MYIVRGIFPSSPRKYEDLASDAHVQCLDYRDAYIFIGVAKHSGKRHTYQSFVRDKVAALLLLARSASSRRVYRVGRWTKVKRVRARWKEKIHSRARTRRKNGALDRPSCYRNRKIGCAVIFNQSLMHARARVSSDFYYRSKWAVLLLKESLKYFARVVLCNVRS